LAGLQGDNGLWSNLGSCSGLTGRSLTKLTVSKLLKLLEWLPESVRSKVSSVTVRTESHSNPKEAKRAVELLGSGSLTALEQRGPKITKASLR